MRAFILGAEPQTALPSSKMKTERIYSHFALKIPYAFPHVRIVAHPKRTNAIPSQLSFSISPKSSITDAWMSATWLVSFFVRRSRQRRNIQQCCQERRERLRRASISRPGPTSDIPVTVRGGTSSASATLSPNAGSPVRDVAVDDPLSTSRSGTPRFFSLNSGPGEGDVDGRDIFDDFRSLVLSWLKIKP
ncbi:hypothetical protein B9Z19DRAFT_844035 [Tuber borchii]|uniref:Uncharacterized protein n=1 Tax=Tuber borchii TaxID=42251 RepID=A0A2T6ZV04_TUBBO|nr:hypothetical protein B9Z19DRAFT_844035 [Tuber borchii]